MKGVKYLGASRIDNIIKALTIFLLISLGIFGYLIYTAYFNPSNTEADLDQSNSGTFKVEGYTLEEMADSVVAYYITEDMTTYEKYLTLHDYIIDTSYYDWEGLSSDNPDIHDGRLVLAYGKGVCDGYAYAYQALCESANLYCDIVTGWTAGADAGHAWNIVQIGENYYHVDVTWDDPTTPDNTPMKTYDYFLVSDDTLRSQGRSFDTNKCKEDYVLA